MSKPVERINQGNKALQFIDKRIKDDNYRGSWSSQHNRYTREIIIEILTLFNKYAPEGKLMRIRDTDISKRPLNTKEESDYAEFCNEAKLKVGIGTQDAMRKNIFVDLHRMELIKRHDSNEEAIEPLAKKKVKYVSLDVQGLKLIREKDLLSQFFIFSKALDKLLGGYINTALQLLRNEDYDLKKIDFYEFMFFVSAIGTDTSFNITMEECVELIKEYRRNSRIQLEALKEMLKTQLDPKNYLGDKTAKRDFHNWWNKIQQVYVLFAETVYFNVVDDEYLYLASIPGDKSEVPKKGKGIRSQSERREYFNQHKVDKRKGFEMHHVIPLSWSESLYEFKLLDNWLNMVYIDAFSHAKITQNQNKNIVMKRDDQNLKLRDYEDNEVKLEKDENILYDYSYQKKMIDYNERLTSTRIT